MVCGLWGLQVVAATAGIRDWSGLPWPAAAMLALAAASWPGLGTGLGMLGAHYAWDWPWTVSAPLFFGPLTLIGVIGLVAGLSAWDAVGWSRSFWPRRA
jgi:hypothetical protein